MKNNIIIPVGYMGSGSSLITDLISEFDGYNAEHGSFEYVFLHCPNGVFDLAYKLLYNNNTLRSDEALHIFQKEMQDLYDRKYYWVGNYKYNFSHNFMELTNQYIDSLVEFKTDIYWYYQEKTNFKMFLQLVFNKFIRIFTFGKCRRKKPLLYSPTWISYISEEDFYRKTKIYLNQLWDELGINNHHIILDQLLLPQNISEMDKYFDENAHAFIIDRDPRDVFIINKYIWSNSNEIVPYPIDVHEFCRYYRKLRTISKKENKSNAHYFHFEDFIYYYDETINKIMDILDLSPESHVSKMKKFNPKKSIENTQLFLNEKFFEEKEIIEVELKEYLYQFPYERKSDLSKTF